MSERGRPVDFARLIHRLPIDGRRVDPADPNAYRCAWGGAITCDEREAEVVIPPVSARPGFGDRMLALAGEGHRALTRVLPDGAELAGYSTHLSVELRDHGLRRVARRYTETFAPAAMMLMDTRTSPGVLVRPRPQRLEVGAEYVDGVQLRAAAAFTTGSALALEQSVWRRGERRAFDELWLDVRVAPAVERYGWYLDRAAFGFDLHTRGRNALLRRAGGGTIRAQDYLEAAWSVARESLVDIAAPGDLDAAIRVVTGDLPLPSEGRPPLDGVDGEFGADPAADPDVLGLPARAAIGRVQRPHFVVRSVIETWDFSVFEVRGDRVVFACMPRSDLAQFHDELALGRLDRLLYERLAARPSRSTLATRRQTREPGLFDRLGDVRRLLPREREPISGVRPRSPGGVGRGRPGKSRRGGQPAPRRRVGLALAGIAAIVVVALVAAVALGGGGSKTVVASSPSTTTTSLVPTAASVVLVYAGTVYRIANTLGVAGPRPTRAPGSPAPPVGVTCTPTGCTMSFALAKNIAGNNGTFQATLRFPDAPSGCPAGNALTYVVDVRSKGSLVRSGIRVPKRLLGTITIDSPLSTAPGSVCEGNHDVIDVDSAPSP